MRRVTFTFAAIAVAVAVANMALAQPPEGGRGRGEGQPRRGAEDGPRGGPGGPPNPILQALDADGNREISAEEIKNAAAALATLDKNKDGKLTIDELRPQFEGRGPRPDGPPRERPDGEAGPRRGPGGPEARGGDRFSPEQFIARVMQLDKNEDGKISKDEMPERMQGMLDRADANKDGALDKSELEEAAKRFREGAGRDRGPRGEGDGPVRPRRPNEE